MRRRTHAERDTHTKDERARGREKGELFFARAYVHVRVRVCVNLLWLRL